MWIIKLINLVSVFAECKKAGRLYQPNDCTSWQEFDIIKAVVSFLFQCYTALWVCAFQHNHVICANLGCSVFFPPWVQGALHIWRFCVFTNTLVFRSRLTKKCVLCVCSLTAALVAEEGEKSRTSSCQLFFLDPLCFFFFYQHYWHLFCDTRLLHFHICFCISPFLFTISSIFLHSLDAKKATLSRFCKQETADALCSLAFSCQLLRKLYRGNALHSRGRPIMWFEVSMLPLVYKHQDL